jgi:hypothetical protein
MTAQQFKTLKVGDRIYLPNSWKRGTFTSSEVLKIDRIFGKVQVLLRNKFLSYKYFPSKVEPSKVSAFVGTMKVSL